MLAGDRGCLALVPAEAGEVSDDMAPHETPGWIACLGGPMDGRLVRAPQGPHLNIDRMATTGPARFETHQYERSGDLLLYIGRRA